MSHVTEDFGPARDLVQAGDSDRSLALAFAPADKRDDLAALYAFFIETGHIRDRISEPMPGEIRLQWWRDALGRTSAGQGAAGHPIAEAFAATIERHRLPRDVVDRLLEARIFDLYDDPMPSRTAFEAYAGETASTVMMLAAMILSPDAASDAADAAGHGGVAQTVAAVLQALPLHRRRGQTYLPADILSAAGCTDEALIKGDREAAARAVAAMTAFGRDHARRFQAGFAALPRPLRPAFLPATLALLYLSAIEARGSEIIDRPVIVGPMRKSFHYWRMMRT